MTILGVIPARYASSRFPGKPLCLVNGKTMLQRVYEQTCKSSLLSEVLIATDDERIQAHAQSLGAPVVMTNANHPSGTDRCYEALQLSGINADYLVNIQGDEPFLNPEQINELATACDGKAELITQMIACHDPAVLFDKGEVKICLNARHEAIYFSRQVIPAIKGQAESEWHLHHNYFRHVGMYAYRADILKALTLLKPSPLELAESLEQLRWLEAGYKIKCVSTTYDSHCIDTPEDIAKVLTLMGFQ